MVDLFLVNRYIITLLGSNTVDKQYEKIDNLLERVNNPNEFKPVYINGYVVSHSNSPRYPNGELLRDFVNINSIEPEIQDSIAQEHNLLKKIQTDSHKVIKVTTESVLNIIQNYHTELEQVQYFILLYPQYIWKDAELLKDISKNLNTDITNWDNIYLTKPSKLELTQLDIIDPDSNCRNCVKEYTDMFYGLNLLNSF